MKTKTSSYLVLIGILTLFVVGGFWYLSLYIYSLTEKTTDLKGEVESGEIKIQRDQLLSRSAQDTSQERQQLSNLFIKQNSSIDFVSMIEKTASDFSLDYNTNQIENIDTDSLILQDKQLLKISITVSGGWKGVVNFLEYIETLPYAVKLDKVELVTDLSSKTSDTPSTISASTTGGVSNSSSSKATWKLSIIFSTIKIKDNAR